MSAMHLPCLDKYCLGEEKFVVPADELMTWCLQSQICTSIAKQFEINSIVSNTPSTN